MEKCPHLSKSLECYAGGSGSLRCLENDFHENCVHRQNHEKFKERFK